MRMTVDDQFHDPAALSMMNELGAVHTWPQLIESTLQLASMVVSCDLLVWNRIDYANGGVFARSTQPGSYYEDPEQARGLLTLEDHPTMNYYIAGGNPWAPVRTSDLVPMREFRNTHTWSDLFRPLGVDHQLTVLSDAQPPVAASAWSWNRKGSDFSDDEVARVASIALALRAIEHNPTWRAAIRAFNNGRDPETISFIPGTSIDKDEAIALHEPLTAREVEVLTLVAGGLTATAIAHDLRIAAPTVRKHLEHVYDKLDRHDRLLAVARARSLGLISSVT